MKNQEDGKIEIVKAIQSPRRDLEPEDKEEVLKEEVSHVNEVSSQPEIKEEVSNFNQTVYIPQITEPYRENEFTKSIRVLPTLLGVATLGIVGYFGFNALNQENKPETPRVNLIEKETMTQETQTLLNVNHKEEVKPEHNEPKISETVTTKERPHEVVKPYVEELAVEKESQKVERDVIELLASQKRQAEEEKREIDKVDNIEELVKKEVIQTDKEEKKQALIPKETPKIETVPHKEKRVQSVKKEKAVPKEKSKPRVDFKYEPIKPRIITVRKGDTLVSIAKRFYGNPLNYRRIIHANSQLKSKKSPLRFGQKIIIPRQDNKTKRRYIIVEKGDTLALISQKVYGSRDKISTIVRANQRIRSRRSTLHLGQKIYVPR